jgi:thioesterase domain-containing protein
VINVKLIEQKIELETELKDAKLWINQKEIVEYTNFKEANPSSREAMDKVIAKLKMEDEIWLEREAELISKEVIYKKVALIIEVLNNTLNAMSRHEDISKKYFEELQDGYIKSLEL